MQFIENGSMSGILEGQRIAVYYKVEVQSQ